MVLENIWVIWVVIIYNISKYKCIQKKKKDNIKTKIISQNKNRSRLKGGMSAKNSILAFSAAQAGKAVLLAQLKNKLNTVNIKIRQLQSSRLRKQPK